MLCVAALVAAERTGEWRGTSVFLPKQIRHFAATHANGSKIVKITFSSNRLVR